MSKLILLHSDLMFGSKVREAAGSLGIEVKPVRTGADIESAKGGAQEACLIVDLNSTRGDPFALIEAAKSAGLRRTACFYSHVDQELADRAVSLGGDPVVPRSHFSKKASAILHTLFA
jgi:hypothetical protein